MRVLTIAALLVSACAFSSPHSVAAASSSDGGANYEGAAAAHSECASNAASLECAAAKAHSGLHGTDGLDGARERDVLEFAAIARKFESLSNEWGCAMSGFGLYAVPNEKDSFDNLFKILASALKAKGQLYAAAIVKHFVRRINTDEMKPYTCDGIRFRDASKWRYPTEALVHFKESLAAWMRAHEADPTEVVDFVISNGREVYSRWLLGRVMTLNKDAEGVEEPVPVASVLPLLPLIEGERLEEVRCTAGAEFPLVFKRSAGNEVLLAKAEKYLDECYKTGRIAKKPQIYARSLLSAGREAEGRELLDLAVQRGQLCSAKQRPSSYHRKDLTAAPVWGIEAFAPEVRQALLDLQDPIFDAVNAGQFQFSNDLLTFSMFVVDGKWERTIMHGRTGVNASQCRRWGDRLCGAINRLADVVTEANDAYSFACNETLSMNLWRVQPGAHTGYSLGPSNIHLQVLMPIVAPNTAVVVQVGDEVVKARQGDIVVVDDSFENKLTIVDEEAEDEGRELAAFVNPRGRKVLDPSFNIERGTVVFQMQICHPDMHEKAMEVPGKKCAHLVDKEVADPAQGSSGGNPAAGDMGF